MRTLSWIGALAVVLLASAPLMAESAAPTTPAATPTAGTAPAADHGSWFFPGGLNGAYFGAALGMGLIVIGAARGIGRIGASAVESIARQPEAGGRIFTSMLLSAALIEGFTLIALVFALLIVLKK